MTKQNFVADTIWQRVFFVALDTMFCLELDFQISSKLFGNKIFHLTTIFFLSLHITLYIKRQTIFISIMLTHGFYNEIVLSP